MSGQYVLQQMINGLSLGSIYALAAVGYTMVYGILRLVNFAHGDIMMIGAYAALLLGINMGMPYWAVILVAMAVSCVFGLAIEKFAYRPMRNTNENAVLLASLAVSTLLENAASLFFSPQPKTFSAPEVLTKPRQGVVTTTYLFYLTMVIIVACAILITLFVKKTKAGIAMRACSENLTAARIMGININRIISITFAIGAGLAGLSGCIYASQYSRIDPLMGFVTGLKAFVACVIGGVGNIYGALVGGILLGLAEMLTIGLLPAQFSGYRDTFVFILLIVILLVKPTGIFGAAEERKA